MSTIEIKGKDGKKVGQYTANAKLVGAKASHTTIHRTVVAEDAAGRQGTQSAQTRSEVRGGGRKPYKQKKTGNARQGSTRSPHYAHGAMALAVKPRDYTKKVNRKERRAAILSALAEKIESGNLILADTIAFAKPKTADARKLLMSLDLWKERRVLIILPAVDDATYRSFRNLPNVTVKTAPANAKEAKTDTFSARDLLVAGKVLVAQAAMKEIEEVWCK